MATNSDRLGKLWAGNIYGTNTGKIFLELMPTESGYAGTLRLSDDQFGLAVFDVNASLDGDMLALVCEPKKLPEDVQVGSITAKAKLQPTGQLRGEWASALGTAGTFELHPHLGAGALAHQAHPEQMYTSTRNLGVVRMSKDDVIEIIAVLEKKFPESRIVVSHIDRGAELARFSPDFLKEMQKLDRINWLKLNVQGSAGGGLSKSLTIDLGASFNRIIAQGPDESWVLGEVQATFSSLERREQKLSTALGRYRVNLNQVIGVCAIIAMPDLRLIPRAGFVIAVIALLYLANKIQEIFIPNFIVDFSLSRPRWVDRFWPSALSWIISATAGVAASAVFAFLQGWLNFSPQ
ncbi:MAG: hypothetical protein M3Y22_14845 [Pseudomonadota bacterium]|nr:hypothetical protein [Pseudomonadota bacterium]